MATLDTQCYDILPLQCYITFCKYSSITYLILTYQDAWIGPVKTHKLLNILGILGIFVSFVLTVTFNFVAGSGKSEFLLIVQNLMGHFFVVDFVNTSSNCLLS